MLNRECLAVFPTFRTLGPLVNLAWGVAACSYEGVHTKMPVGSAFEKSTVESWEAKRRITWGHLRAGWSFP